MSSDEELKAELENAVRQYKKNVKEKEIFKFELNLLSDQNKKSQNPNRLNNTRNDFKRAKKKEVINRGVNGDGSAASDIQELINYFFLREKDKSDKVSIQNYIDYNKQGAIPKRRVTKEDIKTSEIKSKMNKTDSKIKQEKIPEVFPNFKQLVLQNLDYTSIKSSNSDEVIVKINEESCSKPFYYIVPENPSPNFFLARGSYYVIPKTPSSDSENRIFFHPENTTQGDLNNSALNPILEISHNGSSDIQRRPKISQNNLGKEVPQKIDSHLNIGPVDVKISDSKYNLETDYGFNKIFSKNFLCSPNQKASGGFHEESDERKADQEKRSVEETEINSGLLLKPEEEDSDSGEEEMSHTEVFKLQFHKALQTLLWEFPSLDAISMKKIAKEYMFDEDGLRNYIQSARLEQKIEQQLQTMVLSLPESNFDELRDKCNEFQGDEELVSNYIQETLRVYKIRQQALELQFILPDADPDFLFREIEKLNGHEDAFNMLSDRLLDSKDYPKLTEDYLNSERRSWWRTYVENFDVKNYVLKVQNPQDFAGVAGDNNKEDYELILKFLQSRYPLQNRDFLIEALESNNKNVTKTCESLKNEECIRLSETLFRSEPFSEAFLEEICYIDHKDEIDNYLKETEEQKEIEREEARLNDFFLYCPLCSEDELIASEVISCLEGHLVCKDCLKRYVFVKLSEGVYRFSCPLENCDTFFCNKTLQEILPESILSNIISKQQAEEVIKAKIDGLESCPYCEFAYIPDPEDKIFKCQNSLCLIETCRKCKEKNHIPLRCEEIERPMDVEARKKIEESMTQELVRTCPNCQKKFVKIDGCNKMVCTCGTIICYICRQIVRGYDHFSRYSGDSCPLYSNNEHLHRKQVVRAGIRTREEILRENPDIRLPNDPTVDGEID